MTDGHRSPGSIRGDGISVADGVKVPGVYVITSKGRPSQTQRCSSSLVPHGADSSAIVAAVAATRPVVVTPGVSTARTAIRDGTDAAAEWRNAAACASVMESGDGASRERIAENRQFADDRLSIKASNCGDAARRGDRRRRPVHVDNRRRDGATEGT